MFKRILILVNGSSYSDKVLAKGAKLAKTLRCTYGYSPYYRKSSFA